MDEGAGGVSPAYDDENEARTLYARATSISSDTDKGKTKTYHVASIKCLKKPTPDEDRSKGRHVGFSGEEKALQKQQLKEIL